MNIHKKLRQLERRVATLEKAHEPYELQIAIQAQKIDHMKMEQIISRRFTRNGEDGEQSDCT